jgi:hypothetical protein
MRSCPIRACAGVLWILLSATPLLSQPAALEVRVGTPQQGWPAMVNVGPLLEDPTLRGALDSALPLRFHLRVELWRNGFFDRLAAIDETLVALVGDPVAGSYTVEARGIERRVPSITAAQGALEALLITQLRPAAAGRYYYLATLEVETLSLSDLDELRNWLRGAVGPAIEGRSSPAQALERGLGRLMIRVIGLPTRRFEARSANFDAQ